MVFFYRWFSVLVGLLFIGDSFAQINYDFRTGDAPFDTTKANQLIFELDNHNFFKNNEYFGVSAEGYTLLGYLLEPSLTYYAGKRLQLKAGVSALKYHGKETFAEVVPVLSARLKLLPEFEMIMGSLQGNVQHQLSEPLYDTEWLYTKPVENGLQFLYEGKKLWADVWLNWEQFIQVGDTFPEILTFGLSTCSQLLKSGNGWNLTAPVQMLVRHTGGQIDEGDVPMQTTVNASLGVETSKQTGGFLNTLTWFGSWLGYSDVTDSNALGINKGHALYTGLKSEGRKGLALLGYWDAHNFIAPKGSPLFQSVSAYDQTVVIPNRQLITGKLAYYKTFQKNIRLSVMVEGYYDLPNAQFDYAYGLHLAFTPDFTIAKIPFF